MNRHQLMLTGILICSTIALITKDVPSLLFGLGIGIIGGLMIEYTGVRITKLWSYGGRSIPIKGLILGWAGVGVVASLATQWTPNLGIAFLLGILYPLLAFEFPNMRRKRWKYGASSWAVLAGWVVTILSFQLAASTLYSFQERGS